MRPYHSWLMTVVILLFRTSAFLTTEATEVSLLDNARDNISHERTLRLAETALENGNIPGENEAEERANAISSVVSKISDKVPLSVKSAWWLERSKPVEYVKEKMGMKGLVGAELKAHRNYQHWVSYADKLEENTIWKLVRQGFSTFQWWNRVGLDKMVTVKDEMTITEILQLKKIQSTNEFQSYKRYANDFDDHMISMFGSGYYRPTQFFDKSAPPLEIMARTQIWAENGRADHHVREFLGLVRPKQGQLSRNPYYQYYLHLKGKV